MKKHNKLSRLLILLLAILQVGCSKTETEQQGSNYTEESVRVSGTVEETESTSMGFWTLDDCKNNTGIYIAHEDGTFTPFYGGGFLDKDDSTYERGMFIRNVRLDLNPKIDKNRKLVVFCDTEYTLKMLPASWETGVIYSELEDGTRGYTRAIKHTYGIDFFTYYENHQTVENKLLYIDGIPAEEYSFEIVEGGPVNAIGYGFPKGATLRLGTQNGSALVEQEYKVDATYFNCQVERSVSGVSNDEHYIYPTPTTDGYAVIDIYDGFQNIEIPSGKYVMVLRMGKSYIAYLINWDNS